MNLPPPNNWFGLAVGAVAVVIGALAWWGVRRHRVRGIRWLGIALGSLTLAAGLLMIAAAGRHLARVRRFNHEFPPPGKMVDVGGYRLHIICAGQGSPTVVWLPGGYGQGLGLDHLHRLVSPTNRSCLVDRSGSGWSEIGPLPKTVALQIDELRRLLEESGETAPFLPVGHSTGGFVAMNFAARHGPLVAGLLLIDPPTAEHYAFTGGTICPYVDRATRRAGWLAGFGLLWSGGSDSATDMVSKALQPVRAAMNGNDAQPKYYVAAASAMAAYCREPLALPRGAGALGGLPLLVLAPDTADRSLDVLAEPFREVLSPFELANLRKLLRSGADGAAALSTRGRLLRGPPGTTHQLPYEDPGFVTAGLRELLSRLTAPTP